MLGSEDTESDSVAEVGNRHFHNVPFRSPVQLFDKLSNFRPIEP